MASVFFLVIFQFLDLGLSDNWISVVTAMMAIIGVLTATMLAGLYINKQIQSNFDLVQDNRDRELIAVKAVLPIALSDFETICSLNVARFFHEDQIDGVAVNKDINDVSFVSTDSIEIIKNCITSASELEQIELVEILHDYQVFTVRSGAKFDEKIHQDQNDPAEQYAEISNLLDWARLHKKVENIFDYARGRPANINADELGTYKGAVLFLCQIFIEDYPNIENHPNFKNT